MKKMIWLLALNVIVLSTKAQTDNVIKITGTKFPFDIMQQWINVYTKTHPDVHFQLSKAIPADSADLQIAAHSFKERELKENQAIIAVNRYVQLPIVNSQREDLKALHNKGFTKKDLKEIYFSNEKKDNLSHTANVYRRDKNVCASRSFSENVTGIQSEVYGTLVNGDDRALSNAVKKDVDGISYNNLGLIYNLQTRKIIDSLAIIPIDINENGKTDADENIYGTLDNVLDYAGNKSSTSLPQDNVNIVFNKNSISKSAVDFLNWIITKGQSYNRAFGFLNLSQDEAANSRKTIDILSKQTAIAR